MIRKSLVQLIKLIALNTSFLLTVDTIKAEASNRQMLKPAAQSLSDSSITATKKKINFSFASFNTLDIKHSIAAESTSPDDSGIPSLRRQPTGGERFEPRRIPLQIPFPKQPYRASPSITIINPSAYGASWKSAGIGVGFQERVRFQDEADGVVGLGFGLGNPQKNVGVQIGISLVDVSAPFRDGAINLKVHRRLPEDFSVALGVQGLTTWGNTDGGSSVYGVTTKRFKLRKDRSKAFSEIYTTVGVGGGQFRTESNINSGDESLGIFSSVAVKIVNPVGLVVEWTGQDLTIGTPIVPFRRLPIVVVPAITDITGSAGDGTRFVFGFGYSFSF